MYHLYVGLITRLYVYIYICIEREIVVDVGQEWYIADLTKLIWLGLKNIGTPVRRVEKILYGYLWHLLDSEFQTVGCLTLVFGNVAPISQVLIV